MTQVCAPVKKWPSDLPVDLYEFNEGPVRFLYDRHQVLRWTLIDWEDRPLLSQGNLIVSYHNNRETPDLEHVLSGMKARHPQACYYKLATYAQSTLDAMRMLHFQRKHRNVIGICMGEKGRLTRILAPIFGAPITYAPLTIDERNAPGQLLWSELSTIYHFKRLNPLTRIYGLIGDPVDQSVGHLFHNDQYRARSMNAVYVKMSIQKDELSAFFKLVQALPMVGFSVTAPLKEALFPYLATVSQEAQKIGAVNTMVRTFQGWEGLNTDGGAAADVLGEVEGKKVVILGAGGAAKAIAYELIQRKAQVMLVNRTAQRARELAHKLQCSYSEHVSTYDILINATSSPWPLNTPSFIPGSTVMDISIRTTPFLIAAQAQHCKTLDGLPMYFNQALIQQGIFARKRA